MTWDPRNLQKKADEELPIGPPPFQGLPEEVDDAVLDAKTPREAILDLDLLFEPLPGPARVPYMLRREYQERGWVDEQTWAQVRRMMTRGIPDT